MNKLSYSLTLLREFARFGRKHRVYWILPVVLVLAVLVLLVAAGQMSAPFLYTLF